MYHLKYLLSFPILTLVTSIYMHRQDCPTCQILASVREVKSCELPTFQEGIKWSKHVCQSDDSRSRNKTLTGYQIKSLPKMERYDAYETSFKVSNVSKIKLTLIYNLKKLINTGLWFLPTTSRTQILPRVVDYVPSFKFLTSHSISKRVYG